MLKYPKIDLFIIGAQKAGTTSLKNYLGEHPEIITHLHTEFTFFSDEDEYKLGYDEKFIKYFNPKKIQNKKIIAKNVTLSFREEAIQKLNKHNPNCEIVFLLREPVQRAYSAYQMAVRGGWMNQSFDYVYEAIEKNKNGEMDQFYRFILDLGIYANQIETLFKYFPKDKISFILYEDLKNDPEKILANLFKKLNINTSFSPNVEKKHNVGGGEKSKYLGKIFKKLRQKNNPIKRIIKSLLSERAFVKLTSRVYSMNSTETKYRPIPNDISLVLKAFYSPHNKKCGKLIGKDLTEIWG